MRKYIVNLGKVEIHLSTFLFLFLATISGRFQNFIFLFIFAFIHELFHFLGAVLLKVEVKSISIMPFGFSLKTEPLINYEWYKEFLVVILGPLSFFISKLLIFLMYDYNIISKVGYENALQANLFILCFNLLPIIPLDGGKIIKIIFGFFITEKNCMKIVGLISFFFLFFYILYLPVQFSIYIFLIYSQSEYWFYFKSNYLVFLISRLKKYNHRIKVHSHNDLFRNYENILNKNNNLIFENEYILKKINE